MKCEQCPSNAKCPGGFEILVDKGHWRDHNMTNEIFTCYSNPEACEG